MEYRIEIIEKLRYEEIIETDSLEEAIQIMEEKYKNEQIVLNSENYVDTVIQEAEDKYELQEELSI